MGRFAGAVFASISSLQPPLARLRVRDAGIGGGRVEAGLVRGSGADGVGHGGVEEDRGRAQSSCAFVGLDEPVPLEAASRLLRDREFDETFGQKGFHGHLELTGHLLVPEALRELRAGYRPTL